MQCVKSRESLKKRKEKIKILKMKAIKMTPTHSDTEKSKKGQMKKMCHYI